jgi:CheY-like chemotaxis protein
MASKILLADDSITIQKVVNLTFADEGIEVVSVSNGDLAEKRLSEVKPDLVLADVFMPGKNGYELCETIKQSTHFRHIPVVLLVGAFEPFDQMEAKRVRADAHLTKPFESRTLVDTVRNLITTNKGRGPLPEYRTLQAEPPEETAQEKVLEAPQPSVIPDLPALNIELTTTDDEPAPPQVLHHAPSVAAQSEESPLELETETAAAIVHPIEIIETEQTRILSSPPPRQTGELVSARPAEPEPDVLEIGADEPVAAAAPQQQEEVQPAAPSVEPAVSDYDASGFKIASTFGYGAQEVMLDFEKVEGGDTTGAAQASAAEDAEAAVLDVEIEPPPPATLSIEVEEPKSAPVVEAATIPEQQPEVHEQSAEPVVTAEPVTTAVTVEPVAAPEPVAASEPVEVLEPVTTPEPVAVSEPVTTDAELVEAITTREGQFVIAEETEAVLPPPVLQADEPLGDVLSDAPATEAFALSEESAPAPVAHLILEPPAISTVQHEALLKSEPKEAFATAPLTPPAAAEEAPFEPATLFTSMDEPSEPPTAVVESAVTTQESAPAEISEPSPAVETSFTASPIWPQEETRFEPIDVESAAGDEMPKEAAATSSASPASEDVETGFEFAHVVAEEPPATSAEEVLETDVLPEAPVSVGRSVELSPATIDEIVRRVVGELTDTVVREIAWDVVPDCVERVIDQMTRESVSKRM